MRNKIIKTCGIMMLGITLFSTGFGLSHAYALKEKVAENATMDIGTVMRHITFTVNYGTNDGEGIYLVGDFCDWSPGNVNAIKFYWSEGNNWTGSTDVISGTVYHCKIVVASYNNPSDVYRWEKDGSGNERVVTFDESTTYNWIWGTY